MGGREGKMVSRPVAKIFFVVQRKWKSRGKQGERDDTKIFSETSRVYAASSADASINH